MRRNARLLAASGAITAMALGCWACTGLLGDFTSGAGDASVEPDASMEGSLGDAPEFDAPQDGGGDVVGPGRDGGACNPGAQCPAGVCMTGTVECTDSGTRCHGTPVANGFSCDAGAVCDNGACVACAGGSDCTPSGSCQKMTISCSTGTSVCADAGLVTNGTSCGQNLFCDNGSCQPCTPGEACTPTGNPCELGTAACSGGQLVCNGTDASAPNGASCGTNQVCDNGQCVSCTANVTCNPNGNACQLGVTSCASGQLTCPFGSNVAPGVSCGTDAVCDGNGNCAACTPNAACNPGGNLCMQGVQSCTNGPQCTNPSNVMNGTSCGTNQVCNAGQCVACTAGGSCSTGNPCTVGAYSCSTGTQVCNSTGNAPYRTPCGTGMACDQGTCVCQASLGGLIGYFPFDGDANDYSGGGHNASASGGSYVAGKLGQAYSFTTGTYVAVPGLSVSGARTVCAWVLPNSSSGTGLPVVVGGSPGAADFLGIQPTGETYAQCGSPGFMYWNSTNYGCQNYTASALPGSWTFTCWGWDGASHTEYFTTPTNWGTNQGNEFFWGQVTIGSNSVSDPSTQPVFSGAIDEVSIWNVELTNADMTTLYNGGMGCLAH